MKEIFHLVFIKTKADTPQNKIDDAIKAIKEMEEHIPEIIELKVGENFTDRAQGYRIALSVKLKQKEDIDIYFHHDAHQSIVKNFIAPIKEDIIVLDFEA